MPMPPTHQSGLPCTLLRLPLPRPPVSWPSISPSWCAPLWTRQSATAFNQPLSLDTSSVTNMNYMFNVRLRACPCAHSPIGLSSPLHASPSTHALLPGPHVALMVRLPLDSAERASVQPAAKSRHVQSHKNERRVLGAAPRVPMPPTHQSGPPCTLHRLPPQRPPVSWPSMSPSWYSPFGLGSMR